MSKQDVMEVFFPIYERELEWLRPRSREMERTILAYRRLLRSSDPSLPDEHDGASWLPLEEKWKS